MKTELIRVSDPRDAGIAAAAALLRAGQTVAIPTETVYGLAADATSAAAVEKIFAAKGRPADNPLIVHIAELAELSGITAGIPDTALALAQAYWPGPLTMILPRGQAIPDIVSAGLPTVAVRMPVHPIAAAVIRAAGVPLAAPSANRSGSPSPTRAADVLADMDGKIPLILDGGESAVGVESTVVSLTGSCPRLLRPGAVTPEALRKIVGKIEIDPAVTGRMAAGPASSPGMKYKHYAPKARVVLLRGTTQGYLDYVNQRAKAGVFALCFSEELSGVAVPAEDFGRDGHPEQQAHLLFTALRALDERGAQVVYAHCPPPAGVGLAVYNRLLRAAAFDEREV